MKSSKAAYASKYRETAEVGEILFPLSKCSYMAMSIHSPIGQSYSSTTLSWGVVYDVDRTKSERPVL